MCIYGRMSVAGRKFSISKLYRLRNTTAQNVISVHSRNFTGKANIFRSHNPLEFKHSFICTLPLLVRIRLIGFYRSFFEVQPSVVVSDRIHCDNSRPWYWIWASVAHALH